RMAADARRAGDDRLVPSRLPAHGGQPLRVRAPVAEAERVGRAHLRIALAEGAAVDGDHEALLDAQAQVVAAARADREPPLQELLVVDLPAARALLPDRGGPRVGRGTLDLAHAVRAAAAAPIALLSPPRKLATRAGASRSPSSTRRASALPTMTASAKPAIQAACSGRPTPRRRCAPRRSGRTGYSSRRGRSAACSRCAASPPARGRAAASSRRRARAPPSAGGRGRRPSGPRTARPARSRRRPRRARRAP